MLLRKIGEDVLAIPQPSHSWLSGQLARAWGNGAFMVPRPHADVCLAAEQHDLGWLSWELAPEFDADSGRPKEFMRLKPSTHVALWTDGVRRARVYGRYPALLVSLHAETIYSRHFALDKASSEDRAVVKTFLTEQRELRGALVKDLASDPQYAAFASPDVTERNRLLIAAVDWMSLQICWGVDKEVRLAEVPTDAGGRTEIVLRPGLDGSVVVDPWPFGSETLQVQAEGRRLKGRFTGAESMREALDRAKAMLVVTTLRRS